MLDSQTEPGATAPLFSIIIPLEWHRGLWERAWQGWQSQTLDRSDFEIIMVIPPNFPHRDRLSTLAATCRLEYSQQSHDIGLCAEGAARARGKFLFFTESHCWPEPDVLEKSLRAFSDHADWAAFSCKSIRISHNRLSEVEADMYEADIEYGMKIHPWRKILDQCFVTRREAYEDCGGLRPEFGHFSEWVLAASYFDRGHRIGYLPDARIHHYYAGSLAELKTFTLDFVEGEIRYLGGERTGPRCNNLEMPPELICQDNFDREMARAILRMIARDIRLSQRSGDRWKRLPALARWVAPAISGDGIARGVAAAGTLHACIATRLAQMAGSREMLRLCFRRYVEALIRYQRLNSIRAERRRRGAGRPDAITGSAIRAAVEAETGFYPQEQYQGSLFRWSETVAAIRFRADAGCHCIRIRCAPVRDLSEGIDLRFYLDEQRLPNAAISAGADVFEIRIELPRSGMFRLGWICNPFQARADPRRLGLPVMAVALAATSNDSRSPSLQR
jgi:hypothetical protein